MAVSTSTQSPFITSAVYWCYFDHSLPLTAVGDFVQEDEVLAEIETDKVRYITPSYYLPTKQLVML